MADFRDLIEEIESLLLSNNKNLAYVKLLNLQEVSADDSSAVELLAGSSRSIISHIISDIFDGREEIASLALRSLGFMIYHPSIVASIGGQDAGVVIESVVKVIMTTDIKSVFNLGIWTISVQQLSSYLTDNHFQSLLGAVVYALDNPMGSLSITFEAMQAIVTLASSLTECMRTTSILWAPPIYKRLVSLDKRDRDMAERCLLNVMPLICPGPLILSETVAADLKVKLLLDLKELRDQGMKLQSLKAWRWHIRLLGPHAIKNKPLVNDMLKILEQTFSDTEPQVQIASLVAWQGLIDALIQPEVQAICKVAALKNDVLDSGTSKNKNTEADRVSKRVKLIMAPLVRIMSSKYKVSVHASCLSTWSYLLHKLEASASCQQIVESVWEPVLGLVFKVGPTDGNKWAWNVCLDLLDSLISGRNPDVMGNIHNQEKKQTSCKSTFRIQMESGMKSALRHYSVNFPPWKLSQVDFFINMISLIVKSMSNVNLTPEFRRLSSNAAQRLFHSVVEAVQRTLVSVSITYDEVAQCLNTIFRFLEEMCKQLTSDDADSHYHAQACLQFLEVATEGIDPSILGSPLYKVNLENQHFKRFGQSTDVELMTVPGISCTDFNGRVLPMVCLGFLYFSVILNSSEEVPGYDLLLEKMGKYLTSLLISYNHEEILHEFVGLLYKNGMLDCMRVWVVLVNSFQNCIDCTSDQPSLKLEISGNAYSSVLHLLSYPFASWSFSRKKFQLPIVIESWKLLFECLCNTLISFHCHYQRFSEDLCGILHVHVERIASAPATGFQFQSEEIKRYEEFTLLCANVVICVLQQLVRSLSPKKNDIDHDVRQSNFKNILVLASWFMKLLRVEKGDTGASNYYLVSRLFSELVNFVRGLHQSEDVLMFFEIISEPFLKYLDGDTHHLLRQVWTEMLKCLQQTQPATKLDSFFLKTQAPLLREALDHKDTAISEATIRFWNSAFGLVKNLEFPKELIPVLDKLFRNRKISICGSSHCTEDTIRSFGVPTTIKKCSKRVEIGANPVNPSQKCDEVRKRKRGRLT